MKKLTEIEKLKFWLDAEITIAKIWLAFIAALLVAYWAGWVVFGLYAVYSAIYSVVRIAKIATDDPDFLKVTKSK